MNEEVFLFHIDFFHFLDWVSHFRMNLFLNQPAAEQDFPEQVDLNLKFPGIKKRRGSALRL